MSAPQVIYDAARFPTWARALWLVLSVGFAWLTAYTLIAWLTGPSFFPRAEQRAADFGWPAPLAAGVAGIICLQISSGRTVLSYQTEKDRLLVESRWLIGGRQRVINGNDILALRVRSRAPDVWWLKYRREDGQWERLISFPSEWAADDTARRLAELLECEVERSAESKTDAK